MAFSAAIRSALSYETGGICANPDCRATTGTFIQGRRDALGDGAHIVAEKQNGPRGQSDLTPEERAMASNGVWLCPTCHRKVDGYLAHEYSIDTLTNWKNDAPIWYRKIQGLAHQAVARPDIRQQVSRPSPTAIQGARNFLEFHGPLANSLCQLRQMQPARDILVTDAVERQILERSTSPGIGRSWIDEWSGLYYCDDYELMEYMKQLARSVDDFKRLPGTMPSGPRRVEFKPIGTLAQAILKYLKQYEEFRQCLQKLEYSGI